MNSLQLVPDANAVDSIYGSELLDVLPLGWMI